MDLLHAGALTLQIVSYPVVIILGWLLIALSPIWYLLRHALAAAELPFRILASLEVCACKLGWHMIHFSRPSNSLLGSILLDACP